MAGVEFRSGGIIKSDLQVILDGLVEGIVVLDDEGAIVDVNRGACRHDPSLQHDGSQRIDRLSLPPRARIRTVPVLLNILDISVHWNRFMRLRSVSVAPRPQSAETSFARHVAQICLSYRETWHADC